MPKRIELSPHATTEELEHRYRKAKDPVERTHHQIVWLLSEGKRTAERLWPLTNEAVANRLFEEIGEIEEALVERCVQLLDQPGAIRDLTNYHWWPQTA